MYFIIFVLQQFCNQEIVALESIHHVVFCVVHSLFRWQSLHFLSSSMELDSVKLLCNQGNIALYA